MKFAVTLHVITGRYGIARVRDGRIIADFLEADVQKACELLNAEAERVEKIGKADTQRLVPQDQRSLTDQLVTLQQLANQNGLYDAADFLGNHTKPPEPPKKFARVEFDDETREMHVRSYGECERVCTCTPSPSCSVHGVSPEDNPFEPDFGRVIRIRKPSKTQEADDPGEKEADEP